MEELEDAFRRREVFLVAHDGIGQPGLIAGRSEIGIRPSPRSHYERLRKQLPAEGDIEWYRDTSRRGQQTAARIFGEPEWAENDQLAPRAMGAWEGRTWDDVRAADAVRAEAFWSQYASSKAPGDAELLTQLMERTDAFLTGMGHRTTWTKAVVVAPPEVVAAAVCFVLEAAPATALRFDISPLSVTRLTRTWIGWQLACLNARP